MAECLAEHALDPEVLLSPAMVDLVNKTRYDRRVEAAAEEAHAAIRRAQMWNAPPVSVPSDPDEVSSYNASFCLAPFHPLLSPHVPELCGTLGM